MIINGPARVFGYEIGYVGRHKGSDRVVCIQFTGRKLGYGTRIIIIPVPGQVKGFIETGDLGMHFYDTINKIVPQNAVFPDQYNNGVLIPEPTAIDHGIIDCLACQFSESDSTYQERLSNHWGSEVHIDPSLEAAMRYYYPGWDMVFCKFENSAVATCTSIGFYYDGPKIVDSYGDEYLYYPFQYNDNNRVFNGEIPELNSASRKRLGFIMGVDQSDELFTRSVKSECLVPLPPEIKENVITHVWDDAVLLNGCIVAHSKTGALTFTSELNQQRCDEETMLIKRRITR